MSEMETAGFTHMVTYDKKMSGQTIPTGLPRSGVVAPKDAPDDD